jgi:hypothetical protein
LTDCTNPLLDEKQLSETRVHSINGLTSGYDKVFLKSLLWRNLRVYYGARAKMIMPTSYELQSCVVENSNEENNENVDVDYYLESSTTRSGSHIPLKICEKKQIENNIKNEIENKLPPTIYITKNPLLSQQKGIF